MVEVAAVCTAFHDADIVGYVKKHLESQGIQRIYFALDKDDEATKEAVAEGDSYQVLFEGWPGNFDQIAVTQALIDWAIEDGCDWVLPFDADEFWMPNDLTQTLLEFFEQVPEGVDIIHAGMYQHHDWNFKELFPKALPKVAFRAYPQAQISFGNHTVDGLPGKIGGGLMLREIQYRSFTHFIQKVGMHNSRPDLPDELQGFHHKQFADKDWMELRSAWREYERVETIWDPIPSQIDPGNLARPYERRNLGDLLESLERGASDIAGHLRRIHDLVYETDAKVVIECGVNTGESTVAFLSALRGTDGHLYSCDIAPPRVRPEVWADARWSFTSCTSIDFAPVNRGADVVFIDTGHTMALTVAELRHFAPLVRDGGCIVLHDTESCPEVALAVRHFGFVIEAAGFQKITRIERYAHSEGLMVLWLAFL